jgi:signal transduction histidine kinase
MTVHSEIDGASGFQLSNEQEINLYRIMQEALSNAARYSGADDVYMTMQSTGDSFLLSVRDEGIGMDLSAAESHGHGLQNMRERARLIGAEMSIKAETGVGTEVEVYLRKEE